MRTHFTEVRDSAAGFAWSDPFWLVAASVAGERLGDSSLRALLHNSSEVEQPITERVQVSSDTPPARAQDPRLGGMGYFTQFHIENLTRVGEGQVESQTETRRGILFNFPGNRWGPWGAKFLRPPPGR